jgi:hypothetical protein
MTHTPTSKQNARPYALVICMAIAIAFVVLGFPLVMGEPGSPSGAENASGVAEENATGGTAEASASNTAGTGSVPLPSDSAAGHMGAGSCGGAGSNCHNAPIPLKKARVRQSEYRIWSREDKHHLAYRVLANERSKRIARNLGLEDAQKAKVCLDCHTDSAPNDKRGVGFQLQDGVACEACHGGGEHYLGPHARGGSTHENNIKLGLYATDRPEARAQLCLSCHLGDEGRFATHRLMGAGHPRISFDLALFTEIQPAHYVVDDDYKKRKQVYSQVQVWAIGQLLAVDRYLKLLSSPKYQGVGPMPDLAFYDCHACHHPVDERDLGDKVATTKLRWRPRNVAGMKTEPGAIRLNDSSMAMLALIAEEIAPTEGKGFRAQMQALHKASFENKQALQRSAEQMRAVVSGLKNNIATHEFTTKEMYGILRRMVTQGKSGAYSDYAAAEQATRGFEAIRFVLQQANTLTPEQAGNYKEIGKKMFEATRDPDTFKPEQFDAAIDQLGGMVPGL